MRGSHIKLFLILFHVWSFLIDLTKQTDAIDEVLSPHSQKKLKYGTFGIASDIFKTEEVSKHDCCHAVIHCYSLCTNTDKCTPEDHFQHSEH